MITTPYRYIFRFIAFCASNFNEFLDKNGPYMAAAIAFYALFSIFPLMLALVTVFGFFLGIEDFNQRLVAALESQVPVLKESGGVRHMATHISHELTPGFSLPVCSTLCWDETDGKSVKGFDHRTDDASRVTCPLCLAGMKVPS